MLQPTEGAANAASDKGLHALEPAYAALDLGTNNCRLLVATPHPRDGRSIRVLDSFSRIVRLGEGVAETGQLSHEAMERTIAALKACQKKLSRYSLTGARFVATEACRRAKNGDAFLRRVLEETGLAIDIISTEEEAQLAFTGCAALLSGGASRAVVFDIGGGSTELMWVDLNKSSHAREQIEDWLSISFGVMNLSDKFGGTNLNDVAFDDMVELLAARIRPFDDGNGISKAIESGDVQLLSTSGTVTTLAAIHLGLPRYDRAKIDGIRLSIADVRATIRKLLDMRPSERFNHPCIGPDRSDYIISGCAIFEAIGRLWPRGDITIADRGVREGIILSLMKP